jgi:hypothetical protein
VGSDCLNSVRISGKLRVSARDDESRHVRVRFTRESVHQAYKRLRVNERFVALDVQDEWLGKARCSFGAAVGAASVTTVSHLRSDAAGGARGHDFQGVSGHNNRGASCGQWAQILGDPDDHGFAAKIGQRLAR